MKVIVTAEGLTPDDFSRSGCDQALAASPRRWHDDYFMALHGRREEAQAEGDEQTVTVCRLLLAVLASRAPWTQVPPPAEDDPVLPTYEMDEGALAYLDQILGLIADDEIRAKAADLLYQRSVRGGGKWDIAAARTAVNAYLSAAARHEEPSSGNWLEAEHRVERAFGIAAELRHAALRQDVLAHIERAISAHAPSPTEDGRVESKGGVEAKTPSRYPAMLMRLLLHFKEGDPARHGALAERLAQEALAANQWEMGREYLEIAARWRGRAGDSAAEVANQEHAAESWVLEAESLVARDDAPAYFYLLAVDRLEGGIKALRSVRGEMKARGLFDEESRLAARIESVRRRHLQYQERGVAALVPIHVSDSIDSGPILAVVEGKTKLEALFDMTLFPLRTRAEVEDIVREQATSPLFELFGLVQMDERGHHTARTADKKSDDEKDEQDEKKPDADFSAHVYQQAVRLYETAAQCHVGPLIVRVGLDHAIGVNDFAVIAHASRFVPAGREPLFARGLYAGMKGDFSLAVHLLIPQVEHAARETVRAGIRADAGLVAEHREMLEDADAPSLGQALREPAYAAQLSRSLGDDAVFALRVILVERFGGNLRNQALHGLVGSDGVQGWLSWYFWWLVLKLCWATAAMASPNGEEGEAQANEEGCAL